MEIVVAIYFAIVFMPLIGLIMLIKCQSMEKKIDGGIILIIGVVLWIWLGIYKG